MDASNGAIYPLAKEPTQAQLRRLCQVMWRWKLCDGCNERKECRTASCPWRKSSNLDSFFSYYGKTTAMYVPDLGGSMAALRTHDDLIEVISVLKESSGESRSAMTAAHFAKRKTARRGDGNDKADEALPQIPDQDRAFSLAARILAMVNSSAKDYGDLEMGLLPVTWEDDISFATFLQEAFPVQQSTGGNEPAQSLPHRHPVLRKSNRWPQLTAKRLKKMAGLDLVSTDNLQNHLRIDLKYGRVEIYHHVSVLKEHLVSSLDCDAHDDVARGISEGNLPRELALETLLTLKEILFPLDFASQSLLRRLVAKKGFDPDLLRADSRQYRRPDEKTVDFRYWGDRLDELFEQMETPLPSGYFERWMERRSGARYVMMATLGGVLIAVLLGALSLAVSIFQAWVGYQQWKHPVNPS